MLLKFVFFRNGREVFIFATFSFCIGNFNQWADGLVRAITLRRSALSDLVHVFGVKSVQLLDLSV